MRKSVEQRLQAEQRATTKKRGFFRRHLWVVICVPALFVITLGALWYLHQKDLNDTNSRASAQAKRLAAAATDEKVALQKKIDDARKAEAEAKAKADAEEAARKAAVATTPSGTVAKAANCDVATPDKITVVVNKKHCFVPLSWAPSDLASVNGYLLRSEAVNQMTAMMNAAAAAGVPFGLTSAYRSYDNQAATYNNWVAVNGSQAAADTVSARPGYSEHQTGLAADLSTSGCVLECFRGSGAYAWLQANAANYGFIERYPVGLTSITGYSPEAWHWRYVGVATATDMKAKGIQTLEQYFGVTGGDY